MKWISIIIMIAILVLYWKFMRNKGSKSDGYNMGITSLFEVLLSVIFFLIFWIMWIMTYA